MERSILVEILSLMVLLLGGACCLFGQGGSAAHSRVPWPSATLTSAGIDARLFEEMLSWMRGSGLQFHSLLVVRGGRLVAEQYFPPHRRDTRQNVFSCTKSVLSTLLGIAQGEGALPPLEKAALSCLPPGASSNTDVRTLQVTLEQLLTMSSGFEPVRSYEMARVPDQAGYVLSKAIVAIPGSQFAYTSGGPHVLSAVLQRAVGMSASAYAAKRLFTPLGIEGWAWESDGRGVSLGSTGLSLTALDLAKLGYLYLKRGDWFGARVLPAQWVEAATRTRVAPRGMSRSESSGYGYLWWVDEWGGFSAHGYGGQYVFVVPGLDLVVVFTAALQEADFPVPWDLMKKYILPGMRE